MNDERYHHIVQQENRFHIVFQEVNRWHSVIHGVLIAGSVFVEVVEDFSENVIPGNSILIDLMQEYLNATRHVKTHQYEEGDELKLHPVV